ncbi:MAG: HD domain-containing protein, partial [Bacteroides sp.]|nr:HD domain-containing protein [Bacteroides sp.]
MEALNKYNENLQKQILSQYGELVRACSDEYSASGMKQIRQAVDFLIEQTGQDQDKLGTHLTLFALKQAEMMVRELGLDALGISSVLIFDVVKQNAVSLSDIENKLGDRTGQIIQELLKISDLDTTTNNSQAENMRNLILTMATDFRVILIKIAERLFLMRQMEGLEEKEQIALSSEAKFLYSPLAHRLGLYNVMSEMEDISMSVLEKDAYQELDAKLKASTEKRDRFIKEFIKPIDENLKKEKLKVEI